MKNKEKMQLALKNLRDGKIIIVSDDKNRENEGDLICSAEFATKQNVNFMATHGRGLICMPISQKFADKLKLAPMTFENTDNHNTAFTVSIDHIKTSTGISAGDRSMTATEFVKKSSQASDFRRPGHMFPLVARSGGVLQRAGHTEATVDLCRLAGLEECGLCCEMMNDDGEMMQRSELEAFSKKFDLTYISINDLAEYRKAHEKLIKKIEAVDLPTKYGDFVLHGYAYEIANQSHVALVMGEVDDGGQILCRIHSECITGDVFGSKKCDCGEQFLASMDMIKKAKKGVLIYLRQEGRGIGLLNKLRAYHLQEKGFDTAQANVALGFEEDPREYFLGAQILKDLGVGSVKLITNNPKKVNDLKKYGIEVSKRVPIRIKPNMHNEFYLKTKKEKMGHIL